MYAQETVSKGTVFSIDGEKISQVVIIVAKSVSVDSVLQITMSDLNGMFSFKTPATGKYILKTSHISYQDTTLLIDTSSSKYPLSITLIPRKEQLREIIITHDKPRLVQKKDTLSYNISSYIDPNDRKLKDLVEKLPGLTLDGNGGIYYKGELITKLLVESEEFFGGGTKLGLDNIPANAIEKLEVIENYSKSNILKNSRKTREQVINLVLKENRKELYFGGFDAATDFQEFFNIHGSLFNFAKRRQNNLIVDTNNTGDAALSYNDTSSFTILNSEQFSLPSLPLNFYSSDTKFAQIRNDLVTLNLKRPSKNSIWDILGLYNHSKTLSRVQDNVAYLNNSTFDNRLIEDTSNSTEIFLRINNFMSSSKKERLFVLAVTSQIGDIESNLTSQSSLDTSSYNNSTALKSLELTSILELTKSLNTKTKLNYGIKTLFSTKHNDGTLSSDQEFLDEIINWEASPVYSILAARQEQVLSASLAATVFMTRNKHNTFKLSNKLDLEFFKNNNLQAQLFETGTLSVLDANFSSIAQLSRFKNDSSAAYNYTKGPFEVNITTLFTFVTQRFENSFDMSSSTSLNILPNASVRYELNVKKSFQLDVGRGLELPSIIDLDNYVNVVSYFQTLQGNNALSNIINNSIRFKYNDLNVNENYSFANRIDYSALENEIQTNYNFDNINRNGVKFIQTNPGFIVRSSHSFLYIFNRMQLGLTLDGRINKRNIVLDSENVSIINNSLRTALKFQTTFKKTPNLWIEPSIEQNSQELNNQRNLVNRFAYRVATDYTLGYRFYSLLSYNSSYVNGDVFFDRLDFEFRYTNKIKSLDFSLIGSNILARDTQRTIIQNSFFLSDSAVETLGKRLMFKMSYNF